MTGSTTSLGRLLNREQGVIKFNQRVLAMADDPAVPLLERLRYITIVSNNLDELFEIRVAELQQLRRLGRSDATQIAEQLKIIAVEVRRLVAEQYRMLNEQVLPRLAEEGVCVLLSSQWTDAQRQWAGEVFMRTIEPVLTPIALDPAHPFPRILNKSLNFIVELEGRDGFGREAGIVIVQAPRALPRVLPVPAAIAGAPHGVMLLSSIVQGFIDTLFPGLKIRESHQFRLTRNSDLFVDDEAVTDLREALQGELSQRQFGDEVRLEVSAATPDHLVARLLREFELDADDCYRVNGPVNLVRLQQLIELVDRADLKFPAFTPRVPASLADRDLFAAIRRRDILLHHPYESFDPVMLFLASAARDPNVVAIKQTVYRTGADSALMQALIDAARQGKAVTVVVELMARFDEQTNINWAERLEEVGAHVVYGVVGHKTHAKMAMVVRRERTDSGEVLRRYVHLGTGNYHPRTALLYEDFGLFTAAPDLCADVHQIFSRLTGMTTEAPLRAITQAPFNLSELIIASIQREIQLARAGKPAWIKAKVNALLSPAVIDALYEASAAGVQIDLIVRGVCALRPGVPGLSDNIRVRSVVGRFLEHSRVYAFGNEGEPKVWLSSADWMDRNLLRRVEIAFPVRDPAIQARVMREGIDLYLRDKRGAWLMDGQGDYRRAGRGQGFSVQLDLLRRLSKK
jgi:polyphosphate kinase